MNNTPIDVYDDIPKDMKKYNNNYGWHFNKKAYIYATKLMYKIDKTTNMRVNVKPYTKEEVDEILERNNVNIRNKTMHDYVFAATMCKADYMGSCIEDEYHLALYIKDVIDDVDASSETTFRRWVATMIGNGDPIDWSELV